MVVNTPACVHRGHGTGGPLLKSASVTSDPTEQAWPVVTWSRCNAVRHPVGRGATGQRDSVTTRHPTYPGYEPPSGALSLGGCLSRAASVAPSLAASLGWAR